MTNSILLGVGRHLIPVPGMIWQRQIAKRGRDARSSLAFMTTDHQRVRDFVVREMPRVRKPLSPELIAESLTLPPKQVERLLNELEQRLLFLFRNEQGEVVWAYPVTIDDTPHQVLFNTGKEANAA